MFVCDAAVERLLETRVASMHPACTFACALLSRVLCVTGDDGDEGMNGFCAAVASCFVANAGYQFEFARVWWFVLASLCPSALLRCETLCLGNV